MIAVVKYNAGNIRSVQTAVERLGYECKITDVPEEIRKADKVILPGVGEAGSAMAHLKERGLDKVIRELKQPVLGICLGLQLLCNYSEEGNVECLGIYDTEVRKLPPRGKVPHMGWNNFTSVSGQLMEGIKKGDDVYYVHSFCAPVNKFTFATAEYLVNFSATMEKDNFFSAQFHPEKSAAVGDIILGNFLKL